MELRLEEEGVGGCGLGERVGKVGRDVGRVKKGE